MNTYRELVYMCLDEIKGMSDDFSFTEDHIMLLLDNYRSLLLKQKYSDVRKTVLESNYQTLCLDLIEVPAIAGVPCHGGRTYLRSKHKVPFLLGIGNTRVYPQDYYQGEIIFVSRDRMRYVGHNKYLQNIIYCSLGPDNYLYFTSSNPQFLYLEKVRLTGIFQNPREAAELSCGTECDRKCDVLDSEFPMEEALQSTLIQLVVKELTGAVYRPADEYNNAVDDLDNRTSGGARQ